VHLIQLGLKIRDIQGETAIGCLELLKKAILMVGVVDMLTQNVIA
jgi:hypothetical protein